MKIGVQGNLRYYDRKKFKSIGHAIVYAYKDFFQKNGYLPEVVQANFDEVDEKDVEMLAPFPLDIELVEREMPSHFILYPIISRRPRHVNRRIPYGR